MHLFMPIFINLIMCYLLYARLQKNIAYLLLSRMINLYLDISCQFPVDITAYHTITGMCRYRFMEKPCEELRSLFEWKQRPWQVSKKQSALV